MGTQTTSEQWTRQFRVPIAVFLGVSLGALVALSVGLVIAYLESTAQDALTSVVFETGRLRLDDLQTTITAAAKHAERDADVVAETIAAGAAADTRVDQAVAASIKAMVAGTSAPDRIEIMLRSGQGAVAERDESGAVEIRSTASDPAERNLQLGWRVEEPANAGAPKLRYATLIVRGTEQIGAVGVAYHVPTLSRILAETLGSYEGVPFLLFDRDKVLAHPNLQERADVGTGLPRMDSVADDRLRFIWDVTPERRALLNDVPGHIDRAGQGIEVYVVEPVAGIEGLPLQIGFHLRAEQFGAAFDQTFLAAVVAGIALILALVATFWLSVALSRPIRRLAGAARSIETLSLENAPKLDHSIMRELDEANGAFGAAMRALSAFSKFVPKDVVRQIMDGTAAGANRTETRELTILFTDLAGFTTFANRRDPDDVARLLDRHFDMVTRTIDEEGGTVDKFLGDGVMAFWGAPSRQPDHAERAVRAARRIAERFGEDASADLRLRLGVFTGLVMVGTTGTEIRMTYTVIGDPVNAAARLQELGKTVAPDARVIALAGDSTMAALGGEDGQAPVGEWTLRGRDEPTSVYRIA